MENKHSQLREVKDVKICPKCGSENIKSDINDVYISDFCGECGFNSRMEGPVMNMSFPVKQKILIKK